MRLLASLGRNLLFILAHFMLAWAFCGLLLGALILIYLAAH